MVGILTLVGNGFFLFMARQNVHAQLVKEVAAVRARGMVVDEDKVAQLEKSAVQRVQTMTGGAGLVGVVFLVLAFLVRRYPVGATAVGLALYLLSTAAFAALDLEPLAKGELGKGALVKVLIVLALIKALQAGIATRRAERASAGPITVG
ncbi:MAG: hypothetical protein HZA54_10290 [Planctomycetes bacterium]|nr:hypothetical protein [Planctomycetota bacterium]